MWERDGASSFTSDFSVQKKGFSVGLFNVAVALRNQKIKITSGNNQVTKVASSVSIPVLSHLTLCFEVERTQDKQKEWLLTYYDSSGNVVLSLGSDSGSMTMIVDGVSCPIDSIISTSDFTSTMKPFCVLWTSSNGRVAVYFNQNYWAKTCSTSVGHSVPTGGQFRLGGQHAFEGNIYNVRLWDYAMTVQQLEELTCNTVGNIVDWDNSHWSIPSSVAQTDATLSCICYPNCIHLTTAAPTSGVTPPTGTPLTTTCESHGPGCPEELYYHRISFEVVDGGSELGQQDVERAVALWLNQTFQGWTEVTVTVDNVSVQLVQRGANPP
ncbi:G-protein coupled receptor 126 isoform X7, partial [Lates japonicus]